MWELVPSDDLIRVHLRDPVPSGFLSEAKEFKWCERAAICYRRRARSCLHPHGRTQILHPFQGYHLGGVFRDSSFPTVVCYFGNVLAAAFVLNTKFLLRDPARKLAHRFLYR